VDFYANNGTTNTLVGTATTGTAGNYSFNWTNVAVGSYSITAQATDNLGASTISSGVGVTSDALPGVTITSPAANAVSVAPGSFTLSATASSSTSTIAKIDFYATDNATSTNTLVGTATTATNGSYSLTWNNVPVGNYNLTAVATDALGITTTSAATGVTAIANVPPGISLTSPAPNTTVTVPGSFTLTASATSSTSSIAKVDFYANDGSTNTLIGTSSATPYTYTWSNVALGTYTLSAIATDTLNATTTSAPVSVTVNTGIAQVYYIHTDHLDTPREITDVNGNTVWQWDNTDPFGNNATNENPNGAGQFSFPLRFPGQYADKETNTYYNVNRDYDPAIGRYIESDPIGLDGGINTYGYVGGNPLSWSDPTGECPWCLVFVVPAALGGGYLGGQALVGKLGSGMGINSNLNTAQQQLMPQMNSAAAECLGGNDLACTNAQNLQKQYYQCAADTTNQAANISNVPSAGLPGKVLGAANKIRTGGK
jgi:RHS repeat-associated protein